MDEPDSTEVTKVEEKLHTQKNSRAKNLSVRRKINFLRKLPRDKNQDVINQASTSRILIGEMSELANEVTIKLIEEGSHDDSELLENVVDPMTRYLIPDLQRDVSNTSNHQLIHQKRIS